MPACPPSTSHAPMTSTARNANTTGKPNVISSSTEPSSATRRTCQLTAFLRSPVQLPGLGLPFSAQAALRAPNELQQQQEQRDGCRRVDPPFGEKVGLEDEPPFAKRLQSDARRVIHDDENDERADGIRKHFERTRKPARHELE